MKNRAQRNNIRFLIADPQGIVSRGLTSLIASFWKPCELVHFNNMESLMVQLRNNPMLVFIDPQLNSLDVKNFINDLKTINNSARILIFSSLNEMIYVVPLLKSGADGFLPKLAIESDIIIAVTLLLAGGKYLNQRIKEAMFDGILKGSDEIGSSKLSIKELIVADYLTAGHGVFEIADTMNLQTNTISTFKNIMFRMLKISNVIELAEKRKLAKRTHG